MNNDTNYTILERALSKARRAVRHGSRHHGGMVRRSRQRLRIRARNDRKQRTDLLAALIKPGRAQRAGAADRRLLKEPKITIRTESRSQREAVTEEGFDCCDDFEIAVDTLLKADVDARTGFVNGHNVGAERSQDARRGAPRRRPARPRRLR